MDIKAFENHVAKTFMGESYDRLVAGMAEELGEIAQITKHLRNEGPDPVQERELTLELGDLMRYATLVAFRSNISLEVILAENMRKMEARYPKKFRTNVHN